MGAQEYLNQIKEALYGYSTVAKIWGGGGLLFQNRYSTKKVDYWTSGFFPGSIYALLERNDKYPEFFPSKKINPDKLETLAKRWSDPLITQSANKTSHDLGFMIMPAFELEYGRSGSMKSKKVIIDAANSLASRFNEKVGCIRSWDCFSDSKSSSFEKDLIVIIDNMCNLNLLYLGAHLSGDPRLSKIATTHADTTLDNHFRKDWSSYHVIVYNRETRKPQLKITHQGYADESSWSRGQAWGILGYAEAYYFTKLQKFLDASMNIAKYYLSQLPEDGVPPWDFHAPDRDIRDVSSAMIAAYGMLKLYEYTNDGNYLTSSLKLVNDNVKYSLNKNSKLCSNGTVELGETDTILNSPTSNNNANARHRITDHGLVYADYYFLRIGNKLLELGLY